MTAAEKELDQVRQNGGASYFWITETQARAERFTRWAKSGRLIRRKDDARDSYPWAVFDVVEVDA